MISRKMSPGRRRQNSKLSDEILLFEDDGARSISPRTFQAIEEASIIGKGKLKRFGADLVGIVEKYSVDKSIPAPSEPKANAQRKRDSAQPQGTKQVSFDLYKSGKTVAEIAAERNLAVSTIEGHIAYFIARREVDISEFLTKEEVAEIAGFFEERNTRSP